MADSNWSAAAREIQAGWVVRRYDSVDGESRGNVMANQGIDKEALSLSVEWDFEGYQVTEALSEPTRRRSLRRSDDAVVIGSTDTVLVFRPE